MAPTAFTFEVTVDSADPHALADWWAEALGWEVENDEAAIRRDVAEGRVDEAEITTHNGVLAWKAGTAIRHPEGPARAPRVLFQLVPEPKTTKNRLHLDIRTTPNEATHLVERLTTNGAALLHHGRHGPYTWTTLTDPEGNELCVVPEVLDHGR
ncbi:VOC family protein [Streptomyces sp. HNM0574]|uniref:VOC family protein n=1 Tax=Streptomyces sp. HNM0574 TaxID=2714954 RepID=UPI00146B2FBC|nr:VOC family protein [Streptomyces sp. HNM0574]NLU65955.1 VOC family protein [Streptomyces sp. HNM0574]